MPEATSNRNSRIAKNTLLLYVRMILVMLVSLYTSRILLEALGISDYGIYNVVGGIVVMFTFMSAALGNASSRFITFALGQGDPQRIRAVFNASRIIHVLIAIIIIIIAETIGLWFLNSKMDIPQQSMVAANWVYQFSIITTAIAIVSVPYNAAIIAHENMNVFAYVSIIEVLFKLAIVFFIKAFSGNRLILYALLIMLVQLSIRIIYGIYCSKSYPETNFIPVKDKALYKEILSFSGWSLIGNLSVSCSTQGLNIVLNMFYGPTVNAARGIAVQVQGAIKSFITNFQTAVSPQITKSYAVGDYTQVINLLFSTCRISFLLVFCLSLPIFVEIDKILDIWLVEVPDYTPLFVRLMILIILIDTCERPVTVAINSTGDIKKYQIYSCSCLLMTLPISYILLYLKFPPQTVFVVNIIMSTLAFAIELFILRAKIPFSLKLFAKDVILRLALVVTLSTIPVILLFIILPHSNLSLVSITGISFLMSILASYFIGLSPVEQEFVKDRLKRLTQKT